MTFVKASQLAQATERATKPTRKRKINPLRFLLLLIPIAIMLAIWGFSGQAGESSISLSNTIAELLGISNKIIRKLAHFTLYFLLGLSVALVIKIITPQHFPSKKQIIFGLICCILYSISDEIHQYFTPERECNPLDVLIDTCGSITGFVTFIGIYRFSSACLNKKSKPIRS